MGWRDGEDGRKNNTRSNAGWKITTYTAGRTMQHGARKTPHTKSGDLRTARQILSIEEGDMLLTGQPQPEQREQDI